MRYIWSDTDLPLVSQGKEGKQERERPGSMDVSNCRSEGGDLDQQPKHDPNDDIHCAHPGIQ